MQGGRTARPSATGHATIRDVAERAGVSVGTVSNLLTRKTPVSPDKRVLIEGAMRELGYVPNGSAQDLRRGRTRFIGFCVPHTESGYYGALVDAFEAAAADRGFELLQVFSRHDPALELRRVIGLLTQRVAGVVLVPTASPQETLRVLAAAQVPAVVMDRAVVSPRFDHVTFDNRGAMRMVIDHVAGRGHRRVALVVRHPRLGITRERIAAFQEGGRRLGLETRVLVGDDDTVFAEALLVHLDGPAPPTVLIASNSGLALRALRLLGTLGLSCPDDLSLVSFDEPPWADVVRPGLTTIRHPSQAIASSAWDLMFKRLTEGDPAFASIVHPAKLVLRDSVAQRR